MDIRQPPREAALRTLRAQRNVIVALSGGVDSAVLLALAVEALGPGRVMAATGVSASLPPWDLDDARAVARHLGVRHLEIATDEADSEGYLANRGDRCFHCRAALFAALARLADEHGYDSVAYGAIKDDVGDHRPGMRAAADRGVLAPLLEAGVGKDAVRRIAREKGLPVRDKPAAACLASRLPVGTPVTSERLAQVQRAEAALRELGFVQLRVRHHGDVARLELDAEGIARLADAALRAEVARRVRSAGFRFVALDLEGYRSGSLNPHQRTGPERETGQ